MRSGMMFSGLKQYSEKSYSEKSHSEEHYSEEHSVISFDSLYEEREYELIAITSSSLLSPAVSISPAN